MTMYGKPQLRQIFKSSYSQRSSTFTQRNCILKNFVNVPTLKVFCHHPNRDCMLKSPYVPKKQGDRVRAGLSAGLSVRTINQVLF